MAGFIDIPDYPGERRAPVVGLEQCLVCGKGMTDATAERGWWVNMTTTGKLAPVDVELDESLDQGWWPVGTECARKIPLTHRCRPT